MSSFTKDAKKFSKSAKKRAKAAQEVGPMNPIKALSDGGFRSEWAFIGGFASIALSMISWLISRAKKDDDRAQSDRWGIFVGHWAPTFFGLGIALRQQEGK
ncbi:MAG: hypothetical protein ABW040_09575 [Microbacteriaceae bacterium]